MTDPLEQKYAGLKDPGIRAFMIAGERFYPPDAVDFTLAEQREFYDRYCAHFRKGRPPGVATEDFRVGDVACRLYRSGATEKPPVLLYLHGGGFVLGGLESHDDVCAEICDGADVAVVAVQYAGAGASFPPPSRIAGRYCNIWAGAFPRSRWVAIALAAPGSRAGAQGARRRWTQTLGPGADLSRPRRRHEPRPYVSQAKGRLAASDVRYYRDIYNGDGSKFTEPLRETDYAGLPPAFLVAAGLDPLHDDCQDYAARLRAAGVAALVRDEPLLVHAFLRARYMSEPARQSFRAIVEAVFALVYRGALPDDEENFSLPRSA
jgi:acetyl esterase